VSGALLTVSVASPVRAAEALDPSAAPQIDTATAADAARDAYLSQSRGLAWVLAGWSVASVASGAALWATAGDDAFRRGIGIQNVAWGGVDGILAAVGLLSSIGQDDQAASAEHWDEQRQTLETIYWVNFGLDVAYITTGALLWGLGDNDDLRGAGAGVALQGSFLFAYDFAGALTMRLD